MYFRYQLTFTYGMERFGHANYKDIRQLANGSAVDGMQITDKSNNEREK